VGESLITTEPLSEESLNMTSGKVLSEKETCLYVIK
jgi:hypothetical protein